MKQKFLTLCKNALTTCMALGTWFEFTQASFLFFGEYPYPKQEDYQN